MTGFSSKPFLFVRHGQVDWNERGLCVGQQDRALTPLGRAQAARAATSLCNVPVGGVFCSPLRRAYETAQIITQNTRYQPQPVLGLSEAALGEWEGLSEAEIRKLLTGWVSGSVTPRGGESFTGFSRRVIDAVTDCLSDSLIDPPLLISHAGVFWALLHELYHEPIDPTHCVPYEFSPTQTGWHIAPLVSSRFSTQSG